MSFETQIVSWAAVALACALAQVALRVKKESAMARRLRDRDPHVMGDLYDAYGRLAYTLIFRVVRDAATAEDLVQETFLRVWNRGVSFDTEKGALGPWILTVARNRAIDHLRSTEGRLSAGALELEKLEHARMFSGFDQQALTIDRARRLKDAFEKLTPTQKTVIEMAYYEGLSQSEMAERLKQPLGTVKTWVRSALKTLREELTEGAAVA